MTDISSNNEKNTKITQLLWKMGKSNQRNIRPSGNLHIRTALYSQSGPEEKKYLLVGLYWSRRLLSEF